jgi:hypothetical protein
MDPDPTSFFDDFKDAKKIISFSSYFFLTTYPQAAGTLSSAFNFLLDFVLKFYFASIIQFAQHLYEKREGSGTGTGSVLLTNGSGRPKIMRILLRI